MPMGLSAAMSGRWGTKRRVTARPVHHGPWVLMDGAQHWWRMIVCAPLSPHVPLPPPPRACGTIPLTPALGPGPRASDAPAHFCPGFRPRAPSMKASGQPITQRPSIRDCVESVESFSRSSSLTVVAEAAGPMAMARCGTIIFWPMLSTGMRIARLAMRASILTCLRSLTCRNKAVDGSF